MSKPDPDLMPPLDGLFCAGAILASGWALWGPAVGFLMLAITMVGCWALNRVCKAWERRP